MTDGSAHPMPSTPPLRRPPAADARPPVRPGRAGAPVLAGALACLVAAVGCVGPTGTEAAYRDKARQAATSMVGVIGSARLATRTLLAGRATRPFTDSVVSRAERDAAWVRTAFDSRQPPGPAGDRLRGRLDPPLDAAVSALSDLRVAVRRGDRAAARAALHALDGPLRTLEGLAGR